MAKLLDAIHTPDDLKQVPLAHLPALAQEIRQELLETVSQLGGHLASSLGAVELCLALHYVFDAPNDQLVWDMGYQAYTHKLLTGRRDRFGTLKQFRGLSGFCNKEESRYDVFTAGHGGTCLSTAMGLALARNHGGNGRRVVAIIGDASLGEGMALEALNHIGHAAPDLLVILNDNKMSIAPPVGGLSRYLNRIITDPLYNRLHHTLKEILTRLPKGERLVRIGKKMEESLKGLVVPGLLFEELGLRYVGPIDGHNVAEMIATLHNVKRLKGPILLHVQTLKGKGYQPAVDDPERFHKTEPFDLETGKPLSVSPSAGEPVSPFQKNNRRTGAPAHRLTFSEAFSEALLECAQADARIRAITAAMPEGTGLAPFAKRFPERYIDVGMAEQHALGLAAGLARGGLKPVIAIYSTFLQRAFDQIMHELCLQNLPVVLAIDRGGLVGEDGPTHHGVFDVAYLRMFPNITVMSPKDPEELRAMLRLALALPGPVALRYARGGVLCGDPERKVKNGSLGKPARRLSVGKAELLQPGQGRDDARGQRVALVALGSLVYPALEVAQRLRQDGIDVAVVNARFVKPLDEALLQQLAAQLGAIVTLEEAQVAGGFGSAVAEALDRLGLSGVLVHRIGLPDAFVEHGKRAQLLTLCGFDVDQLTARIQQWCRTLPSSSTALGVTLESA